MGDDRFKKIDDSAFSPESVEFELGGKVHRFDEPSHRRARRLRVRLFSLVDKHIGIFDQRTGKPKETSKYSEVYQVTEDSLDFILEVLELGEDSEASENASDAEIAYALMQLRKVLLDPMKLQEGEDLVKKLQENKSTT